MPHDKTDQTTVAVSAKVWNGWEAEYAIDGMINTNQGAGDSASIHQYHYMTITLPEVMVVRAVRLFSSAVSLSIFSTISQYIIIITKFYILGIVDGLF